MTEGIIRGADGINSNLLQQMTKMSQRIEELEQLLLTQDRANLLYSPLSLYEQRWLMAGNLIKNHFPGLRAYYPCNAMGASGQLVDQSGNEMHLTNNSNSKFNVDGLVSFVEYDGSADYHSHADNSHFDITGAEADVDSSKRGLTIGGWSKPDSVTDYDPIISKYQGGQRSYVLGADTAASERWRFGVSSDGNAQKLVDSGGSSLQNTTWQFVVGKFIPSTSVSIYVNGEKTANTSSVPSSIFNGTSTFAIGAIPSAQYFPGCIRDVFVCAAAVPEDYLDLYYQLTAPLLGAV